jgi:hypothetical protein
MHFYSYKKTGKKAKTLLLCIILGLISFRWLMPETNIMSLGHGITINGLRSYFIFLIAVITLSANARKLRKHDFSTEILLYGMFVTWSTCSIFWSVSLSYTLRDSIKLWYPLFIYLITKISVKTMGSAMWLEKKILQSIGILIVISAILLILSILFGWNTQMLENNEMARITDSPGVYSVGIGASVIYIIYNFIISRQKGWKHLLFNYKIWLPSIIILITVTRSYIIGAISAALSALLLSKKVSFLKLLICMLLIFIIGFSIIMFFEPIKSRMFWNPNDVSIMTVIEHPLIFFDDQYVRSSGRYNIWSYYISTLHGYVSPLIGGGLGTVRYILSGGRIFGVETAHGEYSKYLAELGWIGLGFYLFCLFFFVISICSKAIKTHNPFVKRQYILALSCFIYIIVSGIGYNPFYNSFGFTEIIMVFIAMGNSMSKKEPAHLFKKNFGPQNNIKLAA